MSGSKSDEAMAIAREKVREIEDNIRYVLKELPGLSIQESHRRAIEKACDNAKLIADRAAGMLRELSAGPEKRESLIAAQPPALAMTVEEQKKRIIEELMSMNLDFHGIVIRLREASRADDSLQIAYLLFMESATNILNAFSDIQRALEMT